MVRIDTINKQRQAAGAAPIDPSAPVGTSKRSAQQNAAYQEQAHTQQLDTLQTSGQTVQQNTQAGQAPVAAQVRQQQSPQPAPAAPVKPPLTGADLQANALKRRNERLAGYGISEQEFDAVNDIISKGGKIGGAENGQTFFLLPDGSKVFSPMNATATRQAAEVAGIDFEDQVQKEQDQQQQQQDAAILAKQGEAEEGTGTPQPQVPTSPADAGVSAAFANLPPEAQFLAPFLQQFQQSMQQSMQENAQLTQGLLQNQGKSYEAMEDQLAEMREGYKASTEAIQGILEDAKETNEKALAEQKKTEEDRLKWDEYKLRSQLTKRKREDHDALVANIALAGGFGQDAGIREVMESDAEYDTKLSDLAVEFGFARNDLAAKYSALYAENNNNYVNKTVENMKELRSSLERIGMQSISNQQARQKAEQDLILNAWNAQTSLRKELAQQNLNVAGQITDILITDKRLKQQEAAARERMQFQEEQAEKRMSFQESQANVRFGMQIASQERQQSNADRKVEQASADDIRSEKNKIMNHVDVKKYVELRSARDQMKTLLNDLLYSSNPNKVGAAKQIVLTLTAKGADPTTGVREGELAKFGKNQTWLDKVETVGQAIVGGDLTGVSQDAVAAYVEAIDLMSQSQKVNAMAQFAPVINSVITHNNRAEYLPLNPVDVLPPEFLDEATEAFNAYNAAEERRGEGYNFEWETDAAGGGEDFGDALSSLGSFSQVYDTPIASKSTGGLYADSTVQAWGGIHAGIDIRVPQGTVLNSLVEGTIVSIGEQGEWGGSVVIRDSRGAEHRISHLSGLNLDLLPGDFITKGTPIGQTGGQRGTPGAGNSTGPHVDYRVRWNGRYVNPLSYNPYA